jgi:riboflavin biosynthesis pyrimidine reductase
MSQVAVDHPVGLQPLEVLFETAGQVEFGLPGELAELYGGPLGFPEPRLYANFVASVDGVVAIPGEIDSSHAIAAGSQSDRFVMGLLRACADAVLVGAGTLAGSPRTLWTPEHAYPPAAPLYAELRRLRDRPATPTLAILSGSGRIDPSHPGLAERTLVLTSEQGAAQLGDRLPGSAAVVPIGEQSPIDPVAAIEVLRAGGHELILCEGGPMLFGELTAAGLVDELFLTLSPLLAGRSAADRRLSLVEGTPFLPSNPVDCRLLTLRQAGSHLFLRYELPPGRVGA